MVEYVGFDVSKEATAFCVMDAAGKVLARVKVAGRVHAALEARPDLQATFEPLSVRRDGLLGAHIQARRRHAAQPALRGRQLYADGGAQGPKKACAALARKLAAIPQGWLQGGQPSAIAPNALGGQSQRALS